MPEMLSEPFEPDPDDAGVGIGQLLESSIISRATGSSITNGDCK